MDAGGMKMALTYIDNFGIKLTEEGKKAAINAIESGNIESNEKDFIAFIEFIKKFYNSTINEALHYGISEKDIKLDQISKSTLNRIKLESWFDANILSCDKNLSDFDYRENGLTGEDVVSYFCSTDFQNGIKEHGFVSTIKGMTDVIRRNSSLGNEEFFEKMGSKEPKHFGRI